MQKWRFCEWKNGLILTDVDCWPIGWCVPTQDEPSGTIGTTGDGKPALQAAGKRATTSRPTRNPDLFPACTLSEFRRSRTVLFVRDGETFHEWPYRHVSLCRTPLLASHRFLLPASSWSVSVLLRPFLTLLRRILYGAYYYDALRHAAVTHTHTTHGSDRSCLLLVSS